MNQLTIFYVCNYFVLLVYIFINATFLGRGEVGFFHLLMTINTPFFLVMIIKGITKGLGRLFKSSEFGFRYLAVFFFAFTYVFTAIDAKVLSIYRDHFNIQLFKILFAFAMDFLVSGFMCSCCDSSFLRLFVLVD